MTDYFLILLFLFEILLAAAASRGSMRDYFIFSIENLAGGGGGGSKISFLAKLQK